MNFGSKYVYYYNQSDEESVSDDSDSDCYDAPTLSAAGHGNFIQNSPGRPSSSGSGLMSRIGNFFSGRHGSRNARAASLGGGISHDGVGIPQQSVLEHDSFTPQQPEPMQESSLAPGEKKRKKVRKADPNLFTVSVGDYVNPVNVHDNDKRLCCTHCNAVMTAFSQFEVKEGGNNWLCEFCNNYNRDVDITGFIKPTKDDVTFLLESAPVTSKEQRMGENHNVIFVIDISGSMGSTKQIDHREASGRTTRTFVSRLDAVKAAAEFQIRQLKEESPNVRVGLIAFGSSVEVYGDGTTGMRELGGGRQINNIENIKTTIAALPDLKPISETFDVLVQALQRLDTRGMTALGPGLVSAIAQASKVRGSKVIICTDGAANVGIGALPDNHADEIAVTDSRATYKQFGEYAKDGSVIVSVISLEGTDCKLVQLGLVAQITGGIIDIVSQENLNDQFGNILTSRTLATDVTVYLVLHHSLYIRSLDNSEQRSTKEESVGNVSDDTDLVVEFGVKTATNENEQPVTIDVEDGMQSDGPHPRRDEMKRLTTVQEDATMETADDEQSSEQQSTTQSDSTRVDAASQGTLVQGSGDQETLIQGSGDQETLAQGSEDSGSLVQGTGAQANVVQDVEAAEGTMNIPVTSEEQVAAIEAAASSAPVTSSTQPSQLPFQARIKFTSRDSAKYLRVVTILRECTDKREAAESEMDLNVVGAVTSKHVSSVALAGDYRGAHGHVKTNKNMTTRYNMMRSAGTSADADDYLDDLDELEGMVQQQAASTKMHIQRKRDQMPRRSSGHLQSDSANAYAITDDLANQYYQRSTRSSLAYAQKKMARKGK